MEYIQDIFYNFFKCITESDGYPLDRKENIYNEYSLEQCGYDYADDYYWNICYHTLICNNLYSMKEYSESGAQNSTKYELYKCDLDSGQTEIVYVSTEAFLINEYCSNSDSIFWVEYWWDDMTQEVVYRVVMFDCETSSATVMAERCEKDYDELCLSANSRYLTWYDSTKQGTHNIVIYDISKGTYMDFNEESVMKFMPYERLDLYDDGITYFTIENDNSLFVNRLQLDTCEKVKLKIGYKKENERMAGCFSTKKYVGWHTDYYRGVYYIYNYEDGNLSSFQSGNEINIFSFYCDDSFFYMNNQDADEVIKYDVISQELESYHLHDGSGLQFRKGSDGRIEIEVENGERTGASVISFR